MTPRPSSPPCAPNFRPSKVRARTTSALVVGSANSSNSNRLRELAARQGVRTFLIDGAENIQRDWLDGVQHIGLTAGASAPEKLVHEVIARLQEWGAGDVHELDGEAENVTFALPRELRFVGSNPA